MKINFDDPLLNSIFRFEHWINPLVSGWTNNFARILHRSVFRGPEINSVKKFFCHSFRNYLFLFYRDRVKRYPHKLIHSSARGTYEYIASDRWTTTTATTMARTTYGLYHSRLRMVYVYQKRSR